MNEEIIIKNILGDIPNITAEEFEKKKVIIEAIAENERLKGEVIKLQEEMNQYPVVKEPLLRDCVMPGMYVNYDTGKWNKTVGVPSNRFFLPWKKCGFSMFDKDKSKNDSVMDYHGNLSPCGWKVLGVIEGLVYLIHAGIACVYYPNPKIDAATEIKGMNSFCSKEFANSPYAKEALCATIQLFLIVENAYKGIPADLTDIGAPYWLASLTQRNCIGFFDTSRGGYQIRNKKGPEDIYGIRPVVILKENVRMANGTGTKEDPIRLTL